MSDEFPTHLPELHAHRMAAAALLPPSLGAACTADANCSSSALCLAGRCSCPPGFRPWDEHNCTVIHATTPATPWMSLLVLVSGAGLIILFVCCLCILVHRNIATRWTKYYEGGKQSTTTLAVLSQASVVDRTLPIHKATSSQNTDSVGAQQQTDSPVSRDTGTSTYGFKGQPVAADHSSETTNQLTEQRGLRTAPDESFVRPVLSCEEAQAKYPHLQSLLLAPSAVQQEHGETAQSTSSEPPDHPEFSNPSTAEASSGVESELPSALSTSSRRRKRPRGAEAVSRHVVFPAEPATSSMTVVYYENEHEPFVPTQPADATNLAWSSFGTSLDSLLGTPVVARVRTVMDDAALHRTLKTASEYSSMPSAIISRKRSE
ncbi:uncharacterized protein LOC119391377 [Rhipicephalus sanguineus]|uniref:uncharacterized protein LOC119391377 n=1 Tax=Rhipicephalus sanguineus TaxID=34632 RepID=UPI0020C1C24B|nr:uncharacterized protein LOC119391377 [Rhipicephalus sanguineus]